MTGRPPRMPSPSALPATFSRPEARLGSTPGAGLQNTSEPTRLESRSLKVSACMLEAARLSTTGLRGALRVKALGLAYLATLRVFLRDDSPDMAATMAALDRNLSHLGRLARLCSRTQYRPAGVAQET